jgi:hypothetical protein
MAVVSKRTTGFFFITDQTPRHHFQSLSNGLAEAALEDEDFQKPKSNEKKDKKVKRAEEKRRQKEAKRAAAAAEAAQAEYIPGAPRPQQERPQVSAKFCCKLLPKLEGQINEVGMLINVYFEAFLGQKSLQ